MPSGRNNKTALHVILTLLVGACGGFVADLAGLPAAALIGATIAVSTVSFC